MRLNNKGFAITGILYTVFIMFLLVLTSTLAGLQARKTMLERSIMSLENSFNGNDNNEQELIRKINENKTAPVTGRYTFVLNTTLFSNNSTTFDRVGEHEFIAPTTGTYKLEVWGAQGGNAGTYIGGKGGYSAGIIHLEENQKLYVTVGGQGSTSPPGGIAQGGYNGGGSVTGNSSVNHVSGSGGGASDIRTTNKETQIGYYQIDVYGTNLNSVTSFSVFQKEPSYTYEIYYTHKIDSTHVVLYATVNTAPNGTGLEIHTNGANSGVTVSRYVISNLWERLIVAGGGGGARFQANYTDVGAMQANGGSGGGNGLISMGITYFVGQGGNNAPIMKTATDCISSDSRGYEFGVGESNRAQGAGGGGWNGGVSGHNNFCTTTGAGYGGSGYIDGVTNGITISGDKIMPTHDGKKTMIGNEGNGYAKITLLDDSENSGNIICTAYLEKGTNLSEGNKITFIPSSCNDYTYHFSFNMTSDSNINDNIMYLTKIYSFEGDNK